MSLVVKNGDNVKIIVKGADVKEFFEEIKAVLAEC
ncbi:HPr family phosphocarrier protein [Peribacillus frigoritolerans]